MSTIRTFILCLCVVFCVSDSIYASCLPAVMVSGGEDHTLVLTKDPNYVHACGDNYWKQLGNSNISSGEGSYETELIQVEGVGGVSYLNNIRFIAAGWTHSMALDHDGCVYAWGNNVA